MNDFKENLKYTVNNSRQKLKKATMIGGLSLMAAISSVGCSKSNSAKPVEQTTAETELSPNDKAQQFLIEDIQQLIPSLQNQTDFELSSEDSVKIDNLLLNYVFIETSKNFGGDIPYNSIIPQKQNSKLLNTFTINHDEKKHIKNYNTYEDRGLLLDEEATNLYNEYYTNMLTTKPLQNALSTLYKIATNLVKENDQLLQDLSYEDIVNLMKSSYVSAYNNMLLANNNYNSVETYDANEFVIYINQSVDNQYSLSSYLIDDNGNHTLFETTLDSKNAKIINDYVEVYSVFYDDSSNIDDILSTLKVVNEKHFVTEDELIDQLTTIYLHPEKMNAYLKHTGLKKNTTKNSIDDEHSM